MAPTRQSIQKKNICSIWAAETINYHNCQSVLEHFSKQNVLFHVIYTTFNFNLMWTVISAHLNWFLFLRTHVFSFTRLHTILLSSLFISGLLHRPRKMEMILSITLWMLSNENVSDIGAARVDSSFDFIQTAFCRFRPVSR